MGGVGGWEGLIAESTQSDSIVMECEHFFTESISVKLLSNVLYNSASVAPRVS